MKRISLLLFLVLALCAGARATTVTVASTTLSGVNYPSSPSITLRIYATGGNFLTSDGTQILGSAVGASQVYKTVTCSLNSTTHVLTIDSFTIDTTSNALVNAANAQYSFVFFQGNTQKDRWATAIRIPLNLSPTTNWSLILGVNSSPNQKPAPLNYATTTYVDNAILNLGPSAVATTTSEGISRVSVTPADAAHPIAVETGDLRVPTQGENDALVGTSGTPSSSNKYVTSADVRLETVFNVQVYGWLPDGTDHSAQALAMLAAICPSGVGAGGTIYFPPSTGKYRADSQLFIPNDGASPQPHQCNLKFEGAGGGGNWWARYTNNASMLDLRYQASDGNAKIESRGLGVMVVENLTFTDGGSINDTPFLHYTNTQPKIKGNTFVGSHPFSSNPLPIGYVRSAQDAIVLGGPSNVIGGGVTAPFQGYCPVIDKNSFTQMNRGVYLRNFANCGTITDNTFIENTGTVAIESVGFGTGGAGNYGMIVTGNSIEMNVYVYGVKLTNTTGGLFSNSFYDGGDLTLAGQGVSAYNLTTSPANTFIHLTPGEGNGPISFTGDASSLASTNTIGGLPPPATIFDAQELDVFQIYGNTNAQFGNNLIVRGDFNSRWARGAPGQLALESASNPNRSLRLGYRNVGGDYGFIDSQSFNEGSAKPLLINNSEAITSGVIPSAPVGVGNIPYTALAAPLHVGVDPSGNAQRWGDAANINYLKLVVSGSATAFTSTANRPLTFTVNSIEGLRVDGTGATTTPVSLGVGGGTALTKVVKGTVTIDPASINATTVSSQTFTLTGAVAGDSLVLNPPAAGLTAGVLVSQVFVSSSNTITVVFYNTTGGGIDLASASWTYTLIRS